MAGDTVGQARITLVPDLSGFHKKASRELRTMDDLEAKVQLVPDMDTFRKKVEAGSKSLSAKVKVDADTTGVRKKVEAETKGMGATVDVDADVSGFRRRIGLLKTEVKGVGAAFKDGLRQGYTEALEDKRPLARAIRRIDTTFSRMKPTINVDADTAKAEAQIAVAARPRKTTINVDADVGGAVAKIGAVGAASKAVGGGGGGIGRMGAMVGTLIFAIPILTGLVGGLVIGIGGLAVAAVPALAAVAIGFEGIKTAAQNAAPAFNELKTAMTDTLASSMAGGFTQVGVILQGLIPQAQAVGEAFGGMFTSLMTAISTQAMPQLQMMMSGFATFMTAMTPGLTTLTLGFLDLGASFGANAQLIGEGMGNLLAPMGAVLTTLSQTGVLDVVMQNFAGTLTSLGTVLGGLMEGLAYAANGTLPLLNQAFTALGGILPTVGTALGQVGGLFSGILVAAMPVLGVVIEAIGSVAAALMPALQPLIGFGAALAGALAPVGQVLGSLAVLIGQVFAAIAPVLGGLLTAFTPVLQALADGFGQIFAAVSPLIPVLGGALMQIVQAITPVISALAPIISQIAGILAGVVSQVVMALTPVITMLANVLVQMAPVLGEIAGAIGQALIAVVSALAPIIPIIANAFGQILMAILPLVPALGEIVIALLPVFTTLINALLPILPALAGLISALVGALAPVIGLLANLLAAILPPLVRIISAVLVPVIGFLAGVLSTVLSGAIKAVTWGFEMLTAGVGWMVNAVKDHGLDVLTFFMTLPQRILGFFVGAGKWLYNTGRDIVTGLLNGVKSLAGTIGEAFLSVVPGWIKEPFKKALGIASPSKVMAEYGINIGEGLIGGMDAMTPDIQSKSEALASAADPAKTPTGGPGIVPTAPATVPSVSPSAPADKGAAPTDPMDAAGMAAATAAALQGVAVPAWQAFGAAVQSVQSTAISPASALAAGSVRTMATGMQGSMAAVNTSLWNTGATFSSTVNGTITPSWAAAGNNIRATQAGPIETAFRETRNSLNHTAATFGPAANNIAVQWSQVREGTARPVRFVISSVFNDGVVGMWNSVSDLIGTTKMGAYPVRFATGGILPGYTPGRDPHVFTSPTGGTLALSGGEAIMRPEWTKAVGSDYVRNANAAAAKGKLGNPKSTYQGASDRQAFAGGGIVDSMAWVMRNKFPMLQMTSGLRYTDNGYHSKGMAADFSNGYDSTPAMRAAAAWIFGNYRRQTIQLIHSPSPFNIGGGAPAGNGMGYYGGGTMAEHRNHVHWAVNSPVTLDGAGPVPEGFTAAGGDAMSMADMVASFTKPFKDKISAAVSSYRKSGGNVDNYVPKMADKLTESTEAQLTKKMEEMSSFADPGGAGVQRWAPMVSLLLKRYGQSDGLVPTVLRRMNQESGGNPRAINNWDSNAAAGTPSKGLMQVIDPTFAAHRDPTLKNDIWDPMANVGASMRYAMSRYGSLASAYNRAGGYDAGGWLGTGVSTIYNGFTKPEAILSPAESERFVNVADMFIQDANAGGKYVGQYIENQHVLDVDEVEAKTRRGIRRAMKEEGVNV